MGFISEDWQQEEGGGGLNLAAILYWAKWLHRNAKQFNGRAASTEGIANAVEGFVQPSPLDQEKEGA